MRADGFERFAVHEGRLYVSVCRTCLKFIAAAPDPLRLAVSEDQHDCSRSQKKPPARVLLQDAGSTAQG